MLNDQDDPLFEKDQDLLDTEDKIGDLRKVKEPTQEQQDELKKLQKHRQSRYQERLNEFSGKAKSAEDRARQAELKAQQLEDRLNKMESRQGTSPKNHQKVTFDGDEFYTDAALQAMIASNEMSESEAWDHQEQRRVAAAAERIAKKGEKQSFEKVRNETIATVLKDHPQLNPAHSKYSLDDPFTAEVDRLLRNGYQFKPDGLKVAVEDAKRNLRMTDKRPDLSDDLSVTRSSGGNDTPRAKGKKVELEDWEADNAIRMWHNSGMTNPKTGKGYTKTEAVEKALQAKTKRVEDMATR